MARGPKKTTGDIGEKFVASNAPCPACGKALVALPEGYPLFDLQCSACTFRCQVKATVKQRQNAIPGGGWSILNAVLKTGQHVPPLIYVSRVGEAHSGSPVVRFFPFIPRNHLKKVQPFPDGHKRADYLQFRYTRMNRVPSFILNEKNKWEASPMEAN